MPLKTQLPSGPPARLPLVLMGAGGHCRSLIDVLETHGGFAIVGFVDRPETKGAPVLGYPCLGSDEDLEQWVKAPGNFLIAVGQIGLPVRRESLFEKVHRAGGRFPTVLSPQAVVSRHALVGAGSVVFHGAIVNVGARIGQNVIVNTAACVEHDAIVEDHCHLSTGVRVNGGCRVHCRSFVGSGAILKECVTLAEGTIVGAGAVVVADTEPYGLYVGVPARRVKDLTLQE